MCFEDDLSPQHATFVLPITSDNIPQLSSSYTDVCTKICSLSVMLPARLAGFTLFMVRFYVLVKVIAISKFKIFTVASHSLCLGNKLAITISLSCSSNKKLWLHFTIQTSAGIYLVLLNHLLEHFHTLYSAICSAYISKIISLFSTFDI